MDEATVQRCIRENNATLLQEMKAFVASSVSDLKRSNQEIADQNLEHIKKLKRESNPTFKKKSNEDQYKANKAVHETIEDAQSALASGDTAKAKEALEQGTSLIKNRQKLILLADKSLYGWKTVLEYKHNDLADDDEDEKKIHRAESRAARITKRFSSRSQRRSPLHQSPQPSQTLPSPAPSFQRSNFQPGAQRSSGACFACGRTGHWRAFCPYTTGSSSPSPIQSQSK